jgi:hypothetical protein
MIRCKKWNLIAGNLDGFGSRVGGCIIDYYLNFIIDPGLGSVGLVKCERIAIGMNVHMEILGPCRRVGDHHMDLVDEPVIGSRARDHDILT